MSPRRVTLTIQSVMAVVMSVAAVVMPKVAAHADTANCASRGEYDNLRTGLEPYQVANRFDIYGWFIGDNATTFRRGYNPCWDEGDRKIVIVYSYDTQGSISWSVRDVS
jgi:hypothetical protein